MPFVQVVWPAAGVVIEDSLAGGTTGARSTTHTITLPTYSTGDLVVIFWRSDNSAATVTQASGWTELIARNQSGNSRVWYRVMESGDGATMAVTTSTNRTSCWAAYALSGVATGETDFIEGNITGSLDPASLTPTWGSAENLWITFASLFQLDDTLTRPSNYGSQLDATTQDIGDNFDARIASAHRALEATSEDPGAWVQTGSTSSVPHSGVVAVRPSA